jgi:hypothetical protein
MARFNMETADNYGNSNRGSFFTLKEDKEKARVRFLYEGMSDIQGYVVHRVTVGDKERYVNCLREYNEPLEKCPFCAAQMSVTPRLFLKLYNEDAGECQIWERSKSYYQKLSGYADRYKPLYNEVIEIERHGKKGDKQTDYQFFPIDNSSIDITDEKYECSEPLGTIILDKTADEMNEYLNTGDFPQSSEYVARERSSDTEPTRRTPSSTRRAF